MKSPNGPGQESRFFFVICDPDGAGFIVNRSARSWFEARRMAQLDYPRVDVLPWLGGSR